MSNLFDQTPAFLPEAITETLVQAKSVRIERIVACGHSSPDGFWYDQEENEWVVLIVGAARMQFEDKTVELKPGDGSTSLPTASIASHGQRRKERRCGWRCFTKARVEPIDPTGNP